MSDSAAPATRQHMFMRCSIWNSPLFDVVPEGIVIRCKSCRRQEHLIKRTELERIWEELRCDSIEGKEET